MSVDSGTTANGKIAAPVPEEETSADPCTVHEFLARVVTDPGTRAAFAEDPAATASAAGFGELDSDQLAHACRFALDCAPADVVELYRSSLRGALADIDDIGRRTPRTANHAVESATAHHFGHAGDADKIMATHSSALINAHDVLTGNSISAPQPADPAVGALPLGAEQVHHVAATPPAAAPPAGPAAQSVLPASLPSPEQLPRAVTHAAAHGPDELHAATSLPAIGPVAAHLPEPDAGQVTSLDDHGPASAVNGPAEHAPDGLPIVGHVAGHLPLDGLHG